MAQQRERLAQITARTLICPATSWLFTFQMQWRCNNLSKRSALHSAGVWLLLLPPADETTV